MSPELIIAIFFRFVGVAIGLAALFHSHWVFLQTMEFLKESHGESMAAKCGQRFPNSAEGYNGNVKEKHLSNQDFIQKALNEHETIYRYVKGQSTKPTQATWV